jgi:hypothetical protein
MPTIKLAAKAKPKTRAKKEEQPAEEQPALEMQAQDEVALLEAQAQEVVAPETPVTEDAALDWQVESPAPETPAIEEAALDRQVEPAAPQIKKKRTPAIQPIHEQFDLNVADLAGVIHSVWGKSADVFARVAVSRRGELAESDDAFASFVTLRFADGMVDGSSISVQPGDVVRVRGYLTHMDYNESLRKFLDDAHSRYFLDLIPPDDLEAWRSLTFRRHNAVLNVLSLALLNQNGQVTARFGDPLGQDDPVNRARLEGIVARIWEYPHGNETDLYTRLAVYDEHTPVTQHEGNFGRQRRLAHYVTVCFPAGKTASGLKVQLKQRARIRVAGELRDKGQVVTLHEELLKTGLPAVVEMMQRVPNAERISAIKAQQESLHILASALIVYSANGGSRR